MKKKSEQSERLRKSAQEAYKKAQNHKKQGDIQAALLWMNRAHRLTRENPNIIFDLALLYLKINNYDRANDLLKPLMQKFDFYEGWVALAIILCHQNQMKQVIDTLQYALSHHSPTLQTWPLLINLLKQAGNNTGCCGVIGSSNQLWLESFQHSPVTLYLDNEFVLKTNQMQIILPPDWYRYKKLKIEGQEGKLVGSDIDLRIINQTEGFVEVKQDKVMGWLRYPAEPDRRAWLKIENRRGDCISKLSVESEMDVVTLDIPLFRAKTFSIAVDDLPAEELFFKDEHANNLIGSPLDPTLKQRGLSFLTTLQTPSVRNTTLDIQNIPPFLPVHAAFKGQKPVVGHNVALGIVIIIPIYKGKEITLTCIKQVLKTIPKDVNVQLINDCSPDEELIYSIKKLVDNEHVFYSEHRENKGFPSAVNRGMAAWSDYDIILLNSDTIVNRGWVEALCHIAYDEEDIGTVTPFSNDASIFSYPYHDKKNPLPTLQDIRDFASLFKRLYAKSHIEIPTANGFCMFIRHDCLKHTGLFREDLFAQGYGEENEFCIRARHLGWKHVLALDTYIGHQGGVSFQSAKKLLSQRNTKILNDLYPGYDELINQYIQRDFLLPIRRKVDMERIKKINRKKDGPPHYVLLITHRNGGGVERFVQERANRIRLQGLVPIIVKPKLFEEGCQLEICYKSSEIIGHEIEWLFPNLSFNFPDDEQILWQFLRKLTIDYVEVHHLHEHHPFMVHLLSKLNKPYDIYIHDYLVFCPRIVLLNASGTYCGDPMDSKICQNCVPTIDIRDWIKRSGQILEQSRYVYVPSKDTFQRIARRFPTLKQIKLQKLEDDKPQLTLAQIAFFSQLYIHANSQQNDSNFEDKYYRICFIGAFGIEKGFDVIKSLIQDAHKRNLPLNYIIVGRSVDDEALLKSNRVFVTGEYKEEEAISLVMEQNADLAFFPSICPETWCYSLSIAWRAGLKTVGYNIGAIAERIKRTKRGSVMPLNLTIAKQNDFLLKECKNADGKIIND